MDASTDAARAEVLASRTALLEEVQRLEASARAAVDIPAKVRRAPGKTAGLVAGTAFVALGGPKRLFRRARRAVMGQEADLPKSLLPRDIDAAVRALGTDGDKVRGTLEREFVRYLQDRSKVRRESDMAELVTSVAGNLVKPLTARFGRQLAKQLFSPDADGFNDAMAKIRVRYAAQGGGVATSSAAAAAGSGAMAGGGATPGPGGAATSSGTAAPRGSRVPRDRAR